MATIPTAAALDLMYRSSTTGAPTAEFDRLGGYAAVKAAAEAAGYGATPEFIQSYEVANNIPESAYTKLNKQFIGSEGAAKMAQLEADLNSQNAALAAQTRANLAAQSAAADQQAAAEAAQRAAAAQSHGWEGAPTQEQITQMMRDSNNLRLKEEAQAQQKAAAQGAAPPTPTSRASQDAREELERQTKINDNLRQQERYFFEKTREAREASERQIAAQQAAEQQAAAQQAAAQQVAAQQVAAQQAAAQQATAAQAQQQIAAQYASAQQIAAAQAAQQAAMQAVQSAAQARSTGLLDVAPRAAATAGPAINRPTAMMQPSYTQVAPAQITNRAITGTPYSSIYSPATMRQNAPTLASVQAAARSANPYASLMALSQQFLPGSYTGLAGATAANPYLGGYNPNIYQLPPATGLLAPSRVSGYDGVNNSGDQRGPGSGNAAGGGFTGSTNIGGVSGTTTGVASAANSLAAILGNLGLTSISDAIARNVDPNYSHEGRGATGGGVDPQTGLQGQGTTGQTGLYGDASAGSGGIDFGTNLQGQGYLGQTGLYGDASAGMSFNTAQQDFRAAELAAQNLADRNAFTGGLTGLLGGGQLSDFDNAYAGMISDAKMEAAAMAAADAARYSSQIAATASNVQAAQDAADAAAAQAAANAAASDAAQAAKDNADNPSPSGGYDGSYSGGYDGGGDPGGGGGPFAKGGMVNMKPQRHNPPGPDDGYAALQNGEYVIRKKAVKKYGANIFEQINAGRIPAQRLKSLLE